MGKAVTIVSMALVAGITTAGMVLGGCASNKAEGTANAAGAANVASAGLLNSKCPLMPDHPIDPDVTVAFEGGKVAFCCAGCIPEWEQMSMAQKKARLAKSK